MDNRDTNIINKKIREIAKDYKSKGYEVLIEPSILDTPDFLGSFRPDLIAIKENDNVIAEIKISSRLDKHEFKQLESIARIVEKQKNWRFDLIFTNPKEIDDNEGQQLVSENENAKRIDLAKDTLEIDPNFALVMLWTVFESIVRQKESEELSYKSINILLKSLYSKSEINHLEYNKLDDLLKIRSKAVHGYKSSADQADFDSLLQIIQKITGKSNFSFIYEWVTNQDLDDYLEVYSLYTAIQKEESTDLFNVEIDNTGNLILKSYTNNILKLNRNSEKQALLNFLSEEFMNGMDEETYYSFNNFILKDDRDQSLKNNDY